MVMSKEQSLQQGRKEAKILHELRHTHVIRLRDVAGSETRTCLGLDYCRWFSDIRL